MMSNTGPLSGVGNAVQTAGGCGSGTLTTHVPEPPSTRSRVCAYWNYRVRRVMETPRLADVQPEPLFDIIEAFYNKDDQITGWIVSDGPIGDTADELRSELMSMLAAFDKPTLDEADLPGRSKS